MPFATIKIEQDFAIENSEIFLITVVSTDNAVVVATETANVTILDQTIGKQF